MAGKGKTFPIWEGDSFRGILDKYCGSQQSLLITDKV